MGGMGGAAGHHAPAGTASGSRHTSHNPPSNVDDPHFRQGLTSSGRSGRVLISSPGSGEEERGRKGTDLFFDDLSSSASKKAALFGPETAAGRVGKCLCYARVGLPFGPWRAAALGK